MCMKCARCTVTSMDKIDSKELRVRPGVTAMQVGASGRPRLVMHYGRPAAVLVSVDWYQQHKGADDDDAIPDTGVMLSAETTRE